MSEEVVCDMCTYIEKNQMAYARAKATEIAQKAAHEAASAKASLLEPEMYIEYYMFYYRIEYTRVYDEAYTKFKEEYVELLTVKHLVSENICSYHRENIMWYKVGGVEAYYGCK